MTKRRYNQYKLVRKLTLVLAAAPLFQFSQCMTGISQASAGVATGLGVSDNWPTTIINLFQSFTQLFLGAGGIV
jgi:hypothetical protein